MGLLYTTGILARTSPMSLMNERVEFGQFHSRVM